MFSCVYLWHIHLAVSIIQLHFYEIIANFDIICMSRNNYNFWYNLHVCAKNKIHSKKIFLQSKTTLWKFLVSAHFFLTLMFDWIETLSWLEYLIWDEQKDRYNKEKLEENVEIEVRPLLKYLFGNVGKNTSWVL